MTGPNFQASKFSYSLNIPSGGEFLVKKGQMVKAGEVLWEGISGGQIKEYDLASLLAVDPRKVGQYLLCSLGSKVLVGQMIAQKKSVLGAEKVFTSPIKGQLESLTEYGVLKIKEEGGKTEEKTPADGEVIEVGGKIVLEFGGEKVEGDEGIGSQRWGQLKILAKSEGNLFDLGAEDEGKILVVYSGAPAGFVHKAEALGVAGLVCGRIDEGQEAEDLIILATGGKDGMIGDEAWEKLEKLTGHTAFINGKEKYLFVPR